MSKGYVNPTHTKISLRAKPAKAPFGYYGAKLRVAKKIIDKLPPHYAWVEAFCGSAALTLAKSPAPIEIINDADGEIVNLFMQLRDDPKELCQAIALTPYARAEYQMARSKVMGLSSLERARRFLVATMMTINGVNGSTRSGFSYSQSYARGNREARVNRWYNLPERLEKAVERLRGVRIENRDACDIVQMFSNRPATLMYLDPPYFVKREHKYAIDVNNREYHSRLLNKIKRAQCMVLISGYDNNLYNEMLTPETGWEKECIVTQTRSTSGKDLIRTEVLWMNSQFVKARRADKVPIQLTAMEKREKKLNPPR